MPLPFVVFALGLSLDTTEVRHAVARRGCTQEDLPAVEIFLSHARWDGSAATEPPAPYLRLEVAWGAWSRAGGRPLALIPLRRHAEDSLVVRGAWHVTTTTPVWLQGTVTLREVSVGHRVVGEYDVREPGGTRRVGRFTAAWVDARGGCG